MCVVSFPLWTLSLSNCVGSPPPYLNVLFPLACGGPGYKIRKKQKKGSSTCRNRVTGLISGTWSSRQIIVNDDHQIIGQHPDLATRTYSNAPKIRKKNYTWYAHFRKQPTENEKKMKREKKIILNNNNQKGSFNLFICCLKSRENKHKVNETDAKAFARIDLGRCLFYEPRKD